jgi:NTE family protein
LSKTALVLSGGGALGAFQASAEKYAREEKGFKWDIIAGVSVGALNGSLLSMKKYERMDEIWRNIGNDQVFTGSGNAISILFKILTKKKSIFSNKPLWDGLISKELDPEKMKIPFTIGCVNLVEGKYQILTPEHPHFLKAVLASTAIPVVWEPVRIDDEHVSMVDGGILNESPLGDIINANPEKVVIINCTPRKPSVSTKPIKSLLDVAQRSLDLMLNEIFIKDMEEFLRINRLVEQAAKQGVELKKENGKPYKPFETIIIEPTSPVGSNLDFSHQHKTELMQMGRQRAEEILG